MGTWPPRNETWDFTQLLDAYYRDVLQAPAQDPHWVDLEGQSVWEGEYLRYRVDLGMSHAAACQAVWRAIQAVVSPSPQTPLTPLVGRLRIDVNGYYGDDTGVVLPLGCHLGDGVARWCRGEEKEITQLLGVIRAAGYRTVRAWTVLDSGADPYWHGYTVGPHVTPEYWDRVRAFAEAVLAAGLRWTVSQGDVLRVLTRTEQRVAFFERLVAVIPREVVAEVDIANEALNNGASSAAELVPLAQTVAAAWRDVPLVLSSSQSETPEEINALSTRPCTIYSTHSSRAGRYWDKLRHIFSTGYEGALARRSGHNSEPFGQGIAVSSTEHKAEIDADVLCLGAIQALCSGQAWTWFSGAGVKSDRESLEDAVGFRETPRAVAILPADVMLWGIRCHGGAAHRGRRVYACEVADGTRADHTISAVDGRCVIRFYGPSWRECVAERAHTVDASIEFGERGRVLLGRVT